MELFEVIFWILTVVAISCALGVILSRNPVSSVLFLIATFFAVSGHYLILNAQFLAIVNIIVYAGAIMVLFLFVIMLMNLNSDVEPQKSRLVQFAGIISGGILFLVILAALKDTTTRGTLHSEATDIGLIKNLGRTLYTKFVLPFELASVLFLCSMIGAMVIGKKDKPSVAVEHKNPNQN